MKFVCIGFALCSVVALTSCTKTVQKTQDIPRTYQQSVKAGRLSPSAARSLRYVAPQVDLMDAYVERVEAARKRINGMNIPEAEKRGLIRAEMREAGKEWKQKLAANKSPKRR